MDANYRTLPEAQGRGIAGHSMGGFGAFNLAMRHPDLFGAVYTLSAGLFDENGLGDSHMFNEKKKIAHLAQTFTELNLMPVDEALKEMSKYDGAIGFTVAYGAAFAPDPDHGPPFFDYPFDAVDGEMVKNRTVWRQWEEGFGAWPSKIKQYQDNLQKLSGIVFDYGAADAYSWIPRGNEYLSSQLSAAGIANQLYRFDGGHSDKMEERLLTVMLPFFNRVLADPQ
jgi:S-formylglutathione hydrolase FrmB